MLAIIIAIIVSFLVGITLGVILGINTANTTRIVQSTTTRHNIEFNKAVRDIDNRLAALPEQLVDSVREAFPQLYDGPKP